ncbi:MAG: hypothetical protein O3B47_04965 [bacterium]|nr:hypothetical protein [bacterium]
MDNKDILDRLSARSFGLLIGLNPDFADMKSVRAGDVISLISRK